MRDVDICADVADQPLHDIRIVSLPGVLREPSCGVSFSEREPFIDVALAQLEKHLPVLTS